MAGTLRHFLPSVAVVLVASAQAIVSPASCCLLKVAIAARAGCGPVAATHDVRACCHKSGESQAARAPGGVPSPGNCPICSAEAKVASSDRTAVPLPGEQGFSFAPSDEVSLSIASVPAEAAVAEEIDEPFQRTALASCAWLCVWLI
jgi:hypothetical protein